MDNNVKKVISLLKKVRSEKGMTIQEVVDLCEANGDSISFSTVKRIFSPDSENMSFRYETSIRPVARALLGLGEVEAAERESESEIAALRSIVELKSNYIAHLEQDMQEMEAKAAELEAEIREKKIECRRRTVAIMILVCLLFLTMATLIGYLAWDLSHSDQGFFQWSAAYFGASARAI